MPTRSAPTRSAIPAAREACAPRPARLSARGDQRNRCACRRSCSPSTRRISRRASLERYYEEAQDKGASSTCSSCSRAHPRQGRDDRAPQADRPRVRGDAGSRTPRSSTTEDLSAADNRMRSTPSGGSTNRPTVGGVHSTHRKQISRSPPIATSRRCSTSLWLGDGGEVRASTTPSATTTRRSRDGGVPAAVHGLRDLYRRREEWPRVIETLDSRSSCGRTTRSAPVCSRRSADLRQAARVPSARCTTTRAH